MVGSWAGLNVSEGEEPDPGGGIAEGRRGWRGKSPREKDISEDDGGAGCGGGGKPEWKVCWGRTNAEMRFDEGAVIPEETRLPAECCRGMLVEVEAGTEGWRGEVDAGFQVAR